MTAPAATRYSVAIQGFSTFERGALSSFFRLAARRTPSYVQVDALERSDFVIADADHKVSVQAVLDAGREPDTVFIGAGAPRSAMSRLARPIDPMHILRELDTLAEQRQTGPGALSAAVERRMRRPGDAGKGDSATLGGIGELADLMDGTGDAPGNAVAEDKAAGKRAGKPDAPPAQEEHDAGAADNVLVVEDSAVARRFLEVRLRNLGYRVQSVPDAAAANVLLKQRPFTLAFLDVVLGPPGSADGLSLCQKLKHRRGPHALPVPKVVIVTGLSGPADRVRGSLAGCDAYLTKPLDDDELRRTLRTLDPAFAARESHLRR